MGRRKQKKMSEDDDVDLGACCVCERHNRPTNIVMLNLKAPIPGTGWGCFVCGLPTDGATAVVCDGCMGLDVRYAVNGWPLDRQRIPVAQLKLAFDHTKPEEDH